MKDGGPLQLTLWTIMSLCVAGAIVYLAYSCDRAKKDSPGTPVTAMVSRVRAETTLIVVDRIAADKKGERYRITTLDGRTGNRQDERFRYTDDWNPPSPPGCATTSTEHGDLTWDGTTVTLGVRWRIRVRGCHAYGVVGDLVVVATTDPAARAIAFDVHTGNVRWKLRR